MSANDPILRRRTKGWGCLAALALLVSSSVHLSAQGALPVGFAYLRDVDPSIVQDIRYAGADNFIGRRLPGYDGAECILRRDVAAALKQVQSDLAASGLALKVYDCYRPMRATGAMVQWASDGQSAVSTKRFFPRVNKNALFALGYIAAHSQHSTGAAVDLTLIEAASPPPASFDPTARYGPCTGEAAKRAPDNSLDMGTGYDCFDVMSHTGSSAITAEQKQRRAILLTAMASRGFRNYRREWWHFTYSRGGPRSAYDFPVRPRAASLQREQGAGR